MERFDRTFGAYPISIASSLAIEGITHTGEYLDRVGEAPVNNMECLMVNIRTLIRNVIGSFPSVEQYSLRAKEVLECVYEDFMNIKQTVQEYNPYCEVMIYGSTYKSINSDFKNVNFKKFETPKQRMFEQIESEVFLRFKDKYKEIFNEFDYKLKSSKRCVLMTHHPIDLLSYYDFPDLRLLESHTGVIKERKDWYTKLNLPKGTTTIPFNKSTLCIFGDKTYINGQASKVKQAIIAISVKYGWNSLTTKSKMISDCKRGMEPHAAILIREYS